MAERIGISALNPRVSGWQIPWAMHLHHSAVLVFGSLVTKAVQMSVPKNVPLFMLSISNIGGFPPATFCVFLFPVVSPLNLLVCAISKPVRNYLVTQVSTGLLKLAELPLPQYHRFWPPGLPAKWRFTGHTSGSPAVVLGSAVVCKAMSESTVTASIYE